MAATAMNSAFRLAVPLLILAGVSSCHRAPDPTQAPLAGAALGGPFALIDQDGHAVTDRSFAGRWRAIYFGYTYCPDVCPTTLGKLMAGYHQFAKDDPAAAARLAPVFVSVDPGRDTPPVMKQYVRAFGPELVGLTGTPAEIARVAKAYGAYYRAQPKGAGASGYLVDHSSQAILYDPAGKPLALIPTEDGPDAVARLFASWVR